MFRNLESPELHRELMNLQFRSPVGMAPGFDVSAEFYNSAGAAGCGFSIVGPLYFSRKGGIRDAVAAVRNNPPVNILIGFDITKNPSSVSEDDIAKDYLDAYDKGEIAKIEGLSEEKIAELQSIIESVVEIVEEQPQDEEYEQSSDEEETYVCPECGHPITTDMTKCPNCGVELSFEYEDEE